MPRDVHFSHGAPEAVKSKRLRYLDCMWRTRLDPRSTRYVVGKARRRSLVFSQRFMMNLLDNAAEKSHSGAHSPVSAGTKPAAGVAATQFLRRQVFSF